MYIGLAIEHLIMRKQKLLYLFVINTISLYKPISVVPYDYASNFSHSLLLFTWYSEPKRGSPRIVSALWTHCPQDFLFSYLFFLRIMFSLWLAKPIAATIFGDFSDSCCHHLQKDDPAGSEAEMCREKENLYIMNERLQEVTESLLTECVYTTETQLEGSYNCLTRTVMSLSEE